MKISLFVICLLVSSALLYEAQGIRLAKTSISEGHDQKFEGKSRDVKQRSNEKAVVCKGGDCSAAAAGTKKRRISRSGKNKETHHWLPSIHEDYYGPKIHSPRHH